MEKKSTLPSLLCAIGLLTLVLSGCTGVDASPAPTSESAETSSSTPSIAHEAIVFEVQKSRVENATPTGLVLKQFSGTGSTTIQLDPLPEGYTKLGATVNCNGSGDWKTSIVQKEPGWGSAVCTMQGGASVTYPVDDPSKEQTVEVTVDPGTEFWITVFART